MKASKSKTLRLLARFGDRVLTMNAYGVVVDVSGDTMARATPEQTAKMHGYLESIGFYTVPRMCGVVAWRSPTGRAVELDSLYTVEITPLCSCRKHALKFVGQGDYPYNCPAKHATPRALIFAGCDCGRTGWTSVDA